MFWGKYKTKDRIEYMPQLPIYILRKMKKKKKTKKDTGGPEGDKSGTGSQD